MEKEKLELSFKEAMALVKKAKNWTVNGGTKEALKAELQGLYIELEKNFNFLSIEYYSLTICIKNHLGQTIFDEEELYSKELKGVYKEILKKMLIKRKQKEKKKRIKGIKIAMDLLKA